MSESAPIIKIEQRHLDIFSMATRSLFANNSLSKEDAKTFREIGDSLRTIPGLLARIEFWEGSASGQRIAELEEAWNSVCAVFSIGGATRSLSVLMTNLENVKRFADYLRAVEHEFFMIPGEPSDEPGDEESEPEPECVLNCWGAASIDAYVQQFREQLPAAAARLAATMGPPSDNDLLPCPFCGANPELPSGEGTQYEIECDCGMASCGVQISDLMTIEERKADTFIDHRYAVKYIARAKAEAIKQWNTRHTPPNAARFHWLSNFQCLSFTLSKNDDHTCNHQTLSQWIDDDSLDLYSAVPAEELQVMRDTNTDWALQIYPTTRIGFVTCHGATLEYVIDAAMRHYEDLKDAEQKPCA